MPSKRDTRHDYKPLTASPKKGAAPDENGTLRGGGGTARNSPTTTLHNFRTTNGRAVDHKAEQEVAPRVDRETETSAIPEPAVIIDEPTTSGTTSAKKKRRKDKDRALLTGERWLARNGHLFTYIGLFLFSIMVLFRPYELFTSLAFLTATAFYFGLATLAIFIPSQLAVEGTLTT